MTTDEIKQNVTMFDLLPQYGIHIKRGMCSCMFHGTDRHPSMKVYKDGLKCFTCGWTGDVFKFVMDYDRCDFKTAFITLGGTYEHMDKSQKKIVEQGRVRAKVERERQAKAKDDFKTELSNCIDLCRIFIQYLEPFSDEWCEYQNMYTSLLGAWEEKYISSKEVNEVNVLGICRQVRCKYNSFARSNVRAVCD